MISLSLSYSVLHCKPHQLLMDWLNLVQELVFLLLLHSYVEHGGQERTVTFVLMCCNRRWIF